MNHSRLPIKGKSIQHLRFFDRYLTWIRHWTHIKWEKWVGIQSRNLLSPSINRELTYKLMKQCDSNRIEFLTIRNWRKGYTRMHNVNRLESTYNRNRAIALDVGEKWRGAGSYMTEIKCFTTLKYFNGFAMAIWFSFCRIPRFGDVLNEIIPY